MLIRWQELKSNDFLNISNDDIALLLVSSCEQHAKHLPVGTDMFIGKSIAEYTAEKCSRQIFMLPEINCGFSHHHMDFKGTLSINQSTLISVVEDIVSCVIETGFENVLIFNSHGGNNPALHVAVNELGIKYNKNIVLLKYWDFIRDKINDIRDSNLGGIGHAGELETSLMMFLYRELVDDEQMYDYELASGNAWYNPDMFANNLIAKYVNFSDVSQYGNVGVAAHATAEKGEILFNEITKNIIGLLDKFN